MSDVTQRSTRMSRNGKRRREARRGDRRGLRRRKLLGIPGAPRFFKPGDCRVVLYDY